MSMKLGVIFITKCHVCVSGTCINLIISAASLEPLLLAYAIDT